MVALDMKVWLLMVFINVCLGHTLVGSNFTDAWNNFSKDYQLSHATYSMTILDNSTGVPIFTFNQDVGLAPASTMKTVTGAASFHYLGTDYRYKTLLQYSGTISALGVLDGYIYIVGSGDPSLGSWRWNETEGNVIMRHWLNLITVEGIKQCRGIVLDLSIWPGQTETIPGGYVWEDIGNYYGTGTSALNWRENQFTIYLTPGKAVGDPVTIAGYRNPPPFLTFTNELVTGPPGSGDLSIAYVAPDSTQGWLRGSIGIDVPMNFSIGVAIPNSAIYIGNELREGMHWSDSTPIKILYQKEANATHRTTLDTYVSPPLSELIYWFEHMSINQYGELLVKTIANNYNTNINSVLPTYCEKEHGIEQTAVATLDGSGLSPQNRITTWAISHVLYNVAKSATWFPAYEAALPIINDIRMKPGLIRNVLSYSGYVNSKVFSLIINNYNGDTGDMRQKMWNLLDTLK